MSDDIAVLRERAEVEASKHGTLITSARDGARLSRVMRAAYAFATPPGHAVLTTTGRKTGKARHKCVRVARAGATVYLVMLRPPAAVLAYDDDGTPPVSAWVANLRADPRIRVKLGRHVYGGIARELTEPDELAAARTALVEKVYVVDWGEYDLHMRGLPSPRRIREMHGYWFDTGVPIAIDLDRAPMTWRERLTTRVTRRAR